VALSRESRLLTYAVAIPAIAVMAISVSRILFPYDVGQYEANAWGPAQLLTDFENPYGLEVATEPPYLVAPYGPLYYAVVGLGVDLFGEQFWFMRLVSLACVAICALLIGRLIFALTKHRGAALLGVTILLAQFPVQSWAAVQRPDLLALALAVGGVYAAFSGAGRDVGTQRAAMAGLLLAAALLTRQSLFLPVVLVGGWYLGAHALRELVVFAITTAGLLAGATIVFSLGVEGGIIWSLYQLQSGAGVDWAHALDVTRGIAESPVTWLTLALAAWALIAAFAPARRSSQSGGRQRPRGADAACIVATAYTALAAGIAAATSARPGSNVNYWLETCAAIAVTVPLLLVRSSMDRPVRRLVVSGAAVLLALGAGTMAIRLGRGEATRWEGKPYLDSLVDVTERLTRPGAPSFGSYPEIISAANRPYYFNDFVQYDGRSPRLRRAFESAVATRQLAAMVTGSELSPPGYVRVRFGRELPDGVYPQYLHVRRDTRRRPSSR